MNLTVAITGASGAVLCQELLRALDADDRVQRVHFVASENSLRVIAEELGVSGRTNLLDKLLGNGSGKITQHSDSDIGASIASGSYPIGGMIILPSIKSLASLGFKVIATSGTQRYLAEQGVNAAKINKVLEGRPHIVDAIKNGGVQLVFNTTEGTTALADSRSLRAAALLHKVPYYTTLSGAVAAAQGIKAYLEGDLEVHALQSYYQSQA